MADRLYIFDLDGTLVHDYLRNVTCERCGGTGEYVYAATALGQLAEGCPGCRGTGTRLEPDPAHPYVEPHILPGRREELQALAEDGNRFGIATNQAGPALGFCKKAETYERIGKSLMLIEYFYGACFSLQVCLDHPDAAEEPWKARREAVQIKPRKHVLWRRKPGGGMLEDAMDGMDMTPGETIYVGDRETDRMAAENAGVEFRHAGNFFAAAAEVEGR